MHALGAEITDRTPGALIFQKPEKFTRSKCVASSADHAVVVHMAQVYPSANYRLLDYGAADRQFEINFEII